MAVGYRGCSILGFRDVVSAPVCPGCVSPRGSALKPCVEVITGDGILAR